MKMRGAQAAGTIVNIGGAAPKRVGPCSRESEAKGEESAKKAAGSFEQRTK